MNISSRRTILETREKYATESRVVLKRMDDSQAPAPGTKGTVLGVDDIGDILVAWDTGSHLSLIPGVDEFTKEGE